MVDHSVPLGEIVATHGLDGWLKLNPFNPDSSVLSAGVEVCLEKSGQQSIHQLESSKPHKRQFLIKLHGVDAIDAAQPLIGSTLLISDDALDPLEPGQYYHYQVMGFAVVDLHGAVVGTITGTLSTAGGELYMVRGPDKEHLIPAVKEIIEKVDFDDRKVIVNLPQGLLDL
jgi:16S rRNA processing protein RimM